LYLFPQKRLLAKVLLTPDIYVFLFDFPHYTACLYHERVFFHLIICDHFHLVSISLPINIYMVKPNEGYPFLYRLLQIVLLALFLEDHWFWFSWPLASLFNAIQIWPEIH
jgi:hypothetical protein